MLFWDWSIIGEGLLVVQYSGSWKTQESIIELLLRYYYKNWIECWRSDRCSCVGSLISVVLIGSLVGWLVGGTAGWLFSWLLDWLVGRMTSCWLAEWLVDMTAWLDDWLAGWRLVGWLDWLVSRMVSWLGGWLVGHHYTHTHTHTHTPSFDTGHLFSMPPSPFFTLSPCKTPGKNKVFKRNLSIANNNNNLIGCNVSMKGQGA